MPKKPKTPTDDQYAEAWREFESGKVKIGLWAKLYVDNEGNDKKTTAAYLKQRALSAKNSRFYAAAWNEVKSGEKDEGLWARLFSENEGDEKKTKVAYLTAREQQLRGANKRQREPASVKWQRERFENKRQRKIASEREGLKDERQRELASVKWERERLEDEFYDMECKGFYLEVEDGVRRWHEVKYPEWKPGNRYVSFTKVTNMVKEYMKDCEINDYPMRSAVDELED